MRSTGTMPQPAARTTGNEDQHQTQFSCPRCARRFVEPRVLPCLHTLCTPCLHRLAGASPPHIDTTRPTSTQVSTLSSTHTLHTLCTPCLHRLAGASPPHIDTTSQSEVCGAGGSGSRDGPTVLCPTCGAEHQWPAAGVAALPRNYSLQRRMVASSARQLCGLCSSNSPVTSHCMECLTSLCTFCSEAHKRQRHTSDHTVMSLKEASLMGSTLERRLVMCPTHLDQELQLFCEQCCQVICRECCMHSHQGHHCEPVSKAGLVHRASVEEAMQRVRPISEQSFLIADRLKQLENSIEERCGQVDAEIDKFILDYNCGVEERRQSDAGAMRERCGQVDAEIDKFILDYNCGVEERRQSDAGAMRERCGQVDAEIDKFILDYNCGVEERRQSDAGAMRERCGQVDAEIDKFILDYNCGVEERRQSDAGAMRERCGQVDAEIDKFIDDYICAVEEHRHSLHLQVQQARSSKVQMLHSQQQDVQRTAEHTKTALSFAEEALSECSNIELLSLAGPILRRLQWCSDYKAHGATSSLLEPAGLDCLQFLPRESAGLRRAYTLYGVVSTQSVSPQHCLINVDELQNCRQHRRTDVTLVTRDSDNQPLCHGGENVTAELTYRDASCRRIPAQVCDQRDGSYRISFVPDAASNLSVSVFVNNKPIKGSPFQACVRTLRPHPGRFHCCSFCSSGGSKEATCGCGGTIPGGYRGCGHGHTGHPGCRHWSCCGNVLENSECGQPKSSMYHLTL
ncbi:E3 ubiquitin-protein ligase TRIM45 [Bacillus rossius redtenbacheri]|uniref:E3 ubiquitin-protein ligase TRIM45 n=1 Tax=Bacillus rossius redtenbacheri TaxID=93214 RepID=UPI002FDC98F1